MKQLLLTLALAIPAIGFSQIDHVNFHKHMDSLDVKYSADVYDMIIVCQEYDISFKELNRKVRELYREYNKDAVAIRNQYGFATTSNNRNKTWGKYNFTHR